MNKYVTREAPLKLLKDIVRCTPDARGYVDKSFYVVTGERTRMQPPCAHCLRLRSEEEIERVVLQVASILVSRDHAGPVGTGKTVLARMACSDEPARPPALLPFVASPPLATLLLLLVNHGKLVWALAQLGIGAFASLVAPPLTACIILPLPPVSCSHRSGRHFSEREPDCREFAVGCGSCDRAQAHSRGGPFVSRTLLCAPVRTSGGCRVRECPRPAEARQQRLPI